MGLGRWVGERDGVGGNSARMVEEWVEHYGGLWCWRNRFAGVVLECGGGTVWCL